MSVPMAGKVMRAVQYSGYGGGVAGLQHVEVPIPDSNADEILLKLEAATLNPVDWKIQAGMLRPVLPRRFPYIPGTDVAGEVVAVGSGVKKFKPGDKIVAMLSHTVGYYLAYSLHTGGALAEFAVAKESLAVTRPSEVSPAEGAALPVAAQTALQALVQSASIKLDSGSTSKDEEKKNILITAASGGVGIYAVQLAKRGNVHVTATCGARNLEFVKSLGADEVLDYKTPEGAALKSPSGKKYDYVIHCAMGIPWETFEPNLAPKGKVIDITPTPKAMWTFAVKKITFSKKQLVPLLLIPKAKNLEYLLNMVKDKTLKTVVDSTHSLSNAKDAWEKIMSGHATGKVIVEP